MDTDKYRLKMLIHWIMVAILLFSFTANIYSQQSIASETNPESEEETTYTPNYIWIKYRQEPVYISHPRFEYLDTSGSSVVRGAWYDKDNSYMVIRLKTTYYQYCGMPIGAWNSFKKADSFGTFYNNYIKGRFDCRINYVPKY